MRSPYVRGAAAGARPQRSYNSLSMAPHASFAGPPDILRLFPSFVWKSRIEPGRRAAIAAAVLPVLQGLMDEDGDGAAGLARQSRHGLHGLPELAQLMASIQQGMDDVLAFLKIGAGARQITGCWANVNPPGAGHALHTHPNNFLSGVYYLQVQPGADTINFHDPRPQAAVIRPPVTGLTACNTDQVVVPVEPGDLLIFPAWLPHSVSPNESSQPRISISFNAMFAHFAEEMSKPLWGDE